MRVKHCNTVTNEMIIEHEKRKIICGTIIFVSCIVSLKLNAETFTYSGGCFWCTEADTEKLNGVSDVISGFTGGTTLNPRYEPGKWGDHREAAQVEYDPQIISFEELVRHVYRTIDYEDGEGQHKNLLLGCDHLHRTYNPLS